MAAALAAGLTDSNTLVARGVLELLVSYFPVHKVKAAWPPKIYGWVDGQVDVGSQS